MRDFRLSALAASVAADAVCRLCDGGYLCLYAGARPAGEWSRGAATLLATLRFGPRAFNGAIAGVARARALTAEENTPASGTAAWFRAYGADEAPVFDGSVGAGGDYDLVLNTTQIHAGARVSVETLTYTQPEG